MKKYINRAATLLVAISVIFTVGWMSVNDSQFLLKVYTGIDMFSRVYKEIALNYVEDIDPERFARAGVDGMLRTLDPYTVYIGEKEGDELELVTSGKYGGIGVSIGLRDGNIIILNLLEGYSAAKQGIQVGDRILEVDGKSVAGKSLEDIRLLVRGAPGTEIKLTIEREGEKKPLEFVLLREEIPVRNITYIGYVEKGIGYIRLERFSRTAGEDMRNAIKDLKARGELNGLILDLRDNPGGLLEVAVEVVSKFVPESSLVVSTKGRKRESERKYYSTEIPMASGVPLAVLVNRNSASASEIVAGAIQDLDVGVIVGTRTFGKGLVQTISRFSENSSLKITTARYYTPSGRCIQEIDYSKRGTDGTIISTPDSTKRIFHTAHNRLVREGGGIYPDSTVTDSTRNTYLDELSRKGMFFKFANNYAVKIKTLPENFDVTDAMIEDFKKFLQEKGFEYLEESEIRLKELREIAKASSYDKAFYEGISKLEALVQTEKERQANRCKEELRDALRAEILNRLKGEKARIEASLPRDQQVRVAIGILKNKAVYNSLLETKKK